MRLEDNKEEIKLLTKEQINHEIIYRFSAEPI